ncbi:site-specific integrase, partial [Escherichia coli]
QLTMAEPATIRAYLDDIAGRGYAATSQARRLSALRQFFRFLYTENIRTDDPTGTLDAPRKDRSLPKILSEADVEKLLGRAELETLD